MEVTDTATRVLFAIAAACCVLIVFIVSGKS